MYYKAMNRIGRSQKQGECKGFIFKEGQEYKTDGEIILCQTGFHFCKDSVLTSEYYELNNDTTIYAEIEAIGDIEWEMPTKHKGCANHIKILRFLSKKEIIDLLDINSNSGNSNSGYSNSGDRNSGDRNSGNWNSGDWNSTNHETGCLNSIQSETINVFNKPCDRKLWDSTNKPSFLYFEINKDIGYKASFQNSFKNASTEDIELLKKLPNFDAKVFFETSGISLSLTKGLL